MAFVKKSGGWIRDPVDTVDPFSERRELDDLEERIAEGFNDLGSGSDEAQTLTTGQTVTGDGSWPSSGGHSFVCQFTAPFQCRVTEIRIRLTGNGPGGTGNQTCRGVVYGAWGTGSLPTAALVTTGTERTVANPSATGMFTFAMPNDDVLPAGDFAAGIHFGYETGNQQMTIPYATGTANNTLSNDDVYGNGTASPFGSLTAGYSWIPLIEVDIEPSAPDYGSEISDLNDRMTVVEASNTDLDARIDLLEEDGADSGAAATVTLVSVSLLSGDVVQLEPTAVEDGGLFTVSSYASAGGTLSAQDRPVSSWRNGQAITVSASQVTSATMATMGPAARGAYTNGGSTADVEFTTGVVT